MRTLCCLLLLAGVARADLTLDQLDQRQFDALVNAFVAQQCPTPPGQQFNAGACLQAVLQLLLAPRDVQQKALAQAVDTLRMTFAARTADLTVLGALLPPPPPPPTTTSSTTSTSTTTTATTTLDSTTGSTVLPPTSLPAVTTTSVVTTTGLLGSVTTITTLAVPMTLKDVPVAPSTR